MSQEAGKKEIKDEKRGSADDKESKESAKEKRRGKASSKGSGVFFDAFEIHPEKRLEQYNSGEVKAYQASGKDGSKNAYFALICEKHLIPRRKRADVYAGIINPSLAPLVSFGSVYWEPAGEERTIFVYKNVLGKRLIEPGQKPALGWRQEEVMETVVQPMVGILQDFRDKDFVHGSINLENMYDGNTGKGKSKRVMLGDCLATPPSYLQPVLYETIERSMANPIGRGMGTRPDDLYAFGVVLAILMRSNDPLAGLDHNEIIKAKIEHGSYAAITGKDRFKGSILELLRGLLIDDPTQRWTIEEVMTWLDGRRLSPKQAVRQKKAQRPLEFNNQKYTYVASLAMDVDVNPQETLRIVDENDLEQWLHRSLGDDQTIERLEQAVVQSRDKGTGPGFEERLVANVSMALHPDAPMRYKNMHLMGDGVGYALAETIALKKDIRPFVELFTQNIALNWVTVQQNPNLDIGSLISKFDNCRSYVRHQKAGYGIERTLYTLCTESHCMSDKLKDYIVMDPEDMMMAFEDMCEKGKAPALFLDRHSIAFLSVKDPKVIDSYLFELDSPELYKKVFGNLKCLATIQKRANLPPFPGIAEALTDMLNPIYERYHDRKVREKLQKNIKRFAVEGDLVKMAGLLDNVDVVSKDFLAFNAAMKEYAELKKEYNILETRLGDKKKFGTNTGKEVSALVSCIIAAVVILASAFMFFTNKAFF